MACNPEHPVLDDLTSQFPQSLGQVRLRHLRRGGVNPEKSPFEG